MQFRIKECDIYGLRKPLLLLSGWVENIATKLIIEEGNNICYELDFPVTKSKIHSFSIRTPLASKGWLSNYKIFVIDSSGTRYTLMNINSSPYSRFMQQVQPNKYKEFKKVSLKKYQNFLDTTYDLKDNEGYNEWIRKYETFNLVEDYTYKPLISIIIPVYNVDRKYLSECLDSILKQTYQNFEICLADDCSNKKETIDTLKEYMLKDERIKVIFREKNGHISEASNSALSLATGEFIGMMDNDDVLVPHALNEIVRVLNNNNSLDFIYTDEDKIDLDGNRSDPQFKPDFALDKLYGGNYICHFNVIRKTIMDKVGGFRKGYEGAQDFDLFIRIAEITNKFYHIPKILYHWRMIPGSTALDAGEKNYAGEAGKRALEDLFENKGIDVQVDIVVSTHYFIEYIINKAPQVDIVMYIQDIQVEFLKNVNEMVKNLSYYNYQFVFFTDEFEKLNALLENLDFKYDIREIKNNFIQTLNKYIFETNSEYMLYIDAEARLESFDAIEVMVGYCSQKEIGLVGGKVMNRHHVIMDSGYFLIEEKLLPVHFATYYNDYGYYGNLLVPNNYRIIEDVCVMIKIEKLKKIGLFDENIKDDLIFYDVCIRLFARNMRNVILPRVEILSNKEDVRHENHLLPMDKWKELVDINKDLYYNENLTTNIAYRLFK